MSQFLSAYQIHCIAREEGGISSPSQEAKDHIFNLISHHSKYCQGIELLISEGSGIYSFEDIDMAVQAAIAIEQEIDGLNAKNHSAPINLVSIGIVSLINPFTKQTENERSIELATFLANAASAGELYLSEGAYNSLSNPESFSCRFVRQLIRTTETWALNAYEVFWVPTDVEMGKLNRDPNDIDMDIQPIRSFGLKLFLTIVFLFFSVLVMTIGLGPLWAMFTKLLYT